jgi:hypothetical protein
VEAQREDELAQILQLVNRIAVLEFEPRTV